MKPQLPCDEIFERIKQYGVKQFQDCIKVCNRLANDEVVSDGELIDSLFTLASSLDLNNPMMPILSEIIKRYMDKIEMTTTPKGVKREWLDESNLGEVE